MIEYVRDSSGQVVGEISSREPEFDSQQAALLLAHLKMKADMGPHGQPLSEATSPLANPSSWDAKWRYEPVGPYTDYAAKAQEDAKEAYRKRLPKDAPMPNGLRFGVRKVDLTPPE